MIDTGTEAGTTATQDLQRAGRQRMAAGNVPGNVAAGRLDRQPPHSLEAEQGVLGCMMLAPNESIGLCIEKLKSGKPGEGPHVLYDLRHQTIYETLVEMYDHKDPIDLLTLPQYLKDRGKLDEVGGFTYLSSLVDAVPSAANLPFYLEIVREKYVLRRLLRTCTDFSGRVFEDQGNVDGLLDEAERDILAISGDRVDAGVTPIRELVHGAIKTMEEMHARQGMLTGIGTGFQDFDKMTTGLHPGEMVIIAARPSMGKTSLAMNMVEHMILELKVPVGVFSLEMTAESLVLRLLCSGARVNLRNIREGFLAERDFPKLTGAAGRLAKAPLFIDDSPGLSILQLRARARRLWQQHGIKLFVVDYLQLLHSTSRRAQDNRQQEISEISSGIKALAKELGVPIIVLSQLNRELEKEKNRKPRLSDLRESGAIEQDADLVGLLYRPSVAEEEEAGTAQEGDAIAVNLLIAKQRNGPTGDVSLTFMKGYTRFEGVAKIGALDVPGEN